MTVDHTKSEWMTILEAADLIGVSRRVVFEWVRRGTLVAVRRRGRYEVRRADVVGLRAARPRGVARRCERCGHEWVTRKPAPPRSCAGCKSQAWDRPRAVG